MNRQKILLGLLTFCGFYYAYNNYKKKLKSFIIQREISFQNINDIYELGFCGDNNFYFRIKNSNNTSDFFKLKNCFYNSKNPNIIECRFENNIFLLFTKEKNILCILDKNETQTYGLVNQETIDNYKTFSVGDSELHFDILYDFFK